MAKTVNAIWFSQMDGNCIGIVICEDEITKEHKAYIGTGKGIDEEQDCEYIKSNGGQVSSSIFSNIASFLEKK